MQAFIDLAAARFGLTRPAARRATVSVLGLILAKAGRGSFALMTERLSGAETLTDEARELASAFRRHRGAANKTRIHVSRHTDSSGAAPSLVRDCGLRPDEARIFVSLFFDYVRNHAGPDVSREVMRRVGDLDKLVD